VVVPRPPRAPPVRPRRRDRGRGIPFPLPPLTRFPPLPLSRSFVDTEQDPYSAARGFFYAHVGWMLVKQDKSKSGTRDININDLTTDPLVAFQHKFYLPIAMFMAFVLPTLVCGLGWGDYWGGYFIAGVARLVFVHHSTFFVNSLAHWAGAATYTDGHTARNSIITAFLTLGEGYHNFHHEFPSDYRNGVEWWQYDPTKVFIWCLAKLGLAYDLIETPREEIRKGELQMMQKALEKKKQVAFWGPHPDHLEEMTWAHFQSKAGAAVKKESRKSWVVLREDQREGEAEAPKRWFVLDLSPILDKENYSMAHPGSIALLEGHVGEDITTLFNHHKQAKEGGYYKHSNTAHNIACTLRIARLAGAPPTA
jgi:stearoyl-CoA desaturase (Delta-9 desaturase)